MNGNQMESEIRQQPAVLAANAERYFLQLVESLKGYEFQMVLLAARGTSDNAALYARYLIEIHLGIPVSLAAPSVFTRYHAKVRYPKCLAIGISQSGAAPDVAEVLDELRRQGHATLAITNTPDSKLTQVAEHSLLLEAGPELSVAATKTYTASLLALFQLVRALGAKLEAPMASLPTQAWEDECRTVAADSSELLLRADNVFALARGYDFATAQETALKLMECALLPCKSYSLADFQHGPRAIAGPRAAAIVYGAVDGLDLPTISPPDAPLAPSMQPLTPLWNAIFGQHVALALARARALDPDHPPHLSKVTSTL